MKLYFEPSRRTWVLPGQQSRDAERVDLPGGPLDMALWLVEHGVTPKGIADNCPKCGDKPFVAAAIAESNDVETISEWILDQATPAQVEQLFAALGARFHELRKSNEAALIGAAA